MGHGLVDGVHVVVNDECPTCALVAPVVGALRDAGAVTVWSEDDDAGLEVAWHLDLDAVPALVRVADGAIVEKLQGWDRGKWEAITGVALDGAADGLPDWRPGCGSYTVAPDREDELAARFGGLVPLRSRRVEAGSAEDEFELCFARGWTDGLPVVPPTEARVRRMLAGTTRAADEVVAVVPPALVDLTVEKVAINAVMAGCAPEYLPVVLAAVEAFCTESFNGHGLLCTTMPVGPVIVVNGPIARAIGMNSGGNVLGQGNRANLTIGRALQLVVRNVGGGRPGEIDMATQGNPGKLAFCFAEDEAGSPWEPLSVSRGFAPGASTVTLFPGEGPRVVVDQLSREPESLARSLAMALLGVGHPKLAIAFDAMLVVSPEHGRVFREAGWSRARVLEELDAATQRPGVDLVRGAGGVAEGLPDGVRAMEAVPKFRPGGVLVVHAGGQAGLFSSIIGGWVNGETGSQPTTVEVPP
jgi:hypothetical protein